ncbi:MAG: single-stranded DNA-binding protein [Armatimonadota bacterium]|nr:MAG: single-stranded DNA-binding protein [Armatimonadota bacterium]
MSSTAPDGKTEQEIADDLDLLLGVLPARLRERLADESNLSQLLEVVLDIGRAPEARFPEQVLALSSEPVTHEDLDYVVGHVGEFTGDNRAGIERTLHRISAILNRHRKVVGLTCRVGRAVYGTIDMIRDIVETGKSILLLGKPGIGKTTKLREVARVLADEFGKRVIVVDTSNEIAGDGDIPHPGIGSARRMQVPRPDLQHAVMIEAVENHMPEVVVIDEIGTEAEAMAARTIAERGVQLIATAHGTTLDNLLMNPTLSDLVGGIHAVTLSDEEAHRRGTQKTVLERRAPPTFDIVVEIVHFDELAIHHDVAETVDRYLRQEPLKPEIRQRLPSGKVERVLPEREPKVREPRAEYADYARMRPVAPDGALAIFPYGVNKGKLERAIRDLGLQARMVNTMDEADAVVMLKAQERRAPHIAQEAASAGKHLQVLRSNTQHQIMVALREIAHTSGWGPEQVALREAQQAVDQVLMTSEPVELSPRDSYLRRLQHDLANQYHLRSESIDVEPRRRVKISK